METQSDLASQIQKLRTDILWTRCILGGALLCLAVLIAANLRRQAKTVEANEFLLRSLSGNVAARLGQDGFGDTCLTLTAKGQIAVASLCVQDDGSFLDLHNLKSDSRAMLTPGFSSYEPFFRFQPALVINDATNTNFAEVTLEAAAITK